MRGTLTLGLTLVCTALAACAATDPEPDATEDTGSSPAMHDDDSSTTEPDAGPPDTDPPPDTAGEGADAGCAEPQGTFEPFYVQRTGTCGPLDDANYVSVESDIHIEKFANVDVETEIIVMGCTLKFSQVVRDKMGVPQKQIAGTLQIESPTKLSGEATLTRFDENGTPICTGTYDATLSKNTTVGGAAQ